MPLTMGNRLATEKSPYLLQHADNPVDWYPWGPEAFGKAKAEDKPILLSVGYSTCHWCHVMERESFAVPETAALMNEHFVCVKVDREERPDVDKLYMTAVQALSGRGGWPMNVFLTPELKPFFGGTYFPPQARWGQPSWTGLLQRISQLWKQRRAQIESDAASLSGAVARAAAAQAQKRGRPDAGVLSRAETAFTQAYDGRRAGFGSAPKFPMPANLRFLLHRRARGGAEPCQDMAVSTLRAMARGGIFDQLGGGFSRYSTDEAWRIPHFEKMLYDNAQLLECLADACLLSPDAELRRALGSLVEYLRRDLRGPGGGFFSAQDADSLPPGAPEGAHKKEGAFYLWTSGEIAALLGAQAPAFCARYGVVPEGNALSDPHGEFAGACVLYERDSSAMSEPQAAGARADLLEARGRRPRPALDDKVLACWNGLAIAGLARAHAATGDRQALRLAQAAADFLRRELASRDGLTLWRRWRAGSPGVPGMADDYAFLVHGLLELHAADFEPSRLEWASALAREGLRRFAAPGGGLYQTAEGTAAELFARVVEDHDGVEPAPSSVLADACLRLHELTGQAGFRAFAESTLERFGPRLNESPLSMPFLLSACDRALSRPQLLLLAGLERPGGGELLAVARSRLRPDLVLTGFRTADQAALGRLVPAADTLPASARAQAYLCVGGACGLPIEDPAELQQRLDRR